LLKVIIANSFRKTYDGAAGAARHCLRLDALFKERGPPRTCVAFHQRIGSSKQIVHGLTGSNHSRHLGMEYITTPRGGSSGNRANPWAGALLLIKYPGWWRAVCKYCKIFIRKRESI
jgi:hypothetical protein